MPINTQAQDVAQEPQLTIPEVLPVLPLRNVVIYPLMGQGLTVGQERSVRLVDDTMRGDRLIALAAQIDPSVEAPGPEGVRSVGTVGRIVQMMRRPDGVMLVAVQGLGRLVPGLGGAVRREEFPCFAGPSGVVIDSVGLTVEGGLRVGVTRLGGGAM